jgi:Zn-dependent protease
MSLDPITLIATLVALILALTLHEFAHALTSHYLGDTTARDEGRLTINPLAHVDPMLTLALPLISFLTTGIAIGAAKPVPFNPWAVRGGKWGAALVAVAGPLTNLVLAMFFALWLNFMPVTSPVVFQFLGTLIAINVGLFVFNMIPFPPLDGSRVLYAVAPPALRDLMDRIEGMGIVAILFFFMAIYYFGAGKFVALAVRAVMSLLVPAGPLP